MMQFYKVFHFFYFHRKRQQQQHGFFYSLILKFSSLKVIKNATQKCLNRFWHPKIKCTFASDTEADQTHLNRFSITANAAAAAVAIEVLKTCLMMRKAEAALSTIKYDGIIMYYMRPCVAPNFRATLIYGSYIIIKNKTKWQNI